MIHFFWKRKIPSYFCWIGFWIRVCLQFLHFLDRLLDGLWIDSEVDLGVFFLSKIVSKSVFFQSACQKGFARNQGGVARCGPDPQSASILNVLGSKFEFRQHQTLKCAFAKILTPFFIQK